MDFNPLADFLSADIFEEGRRSNYDIGGRFGEPKQNPRFDYWIREQRPRMHRFSFLSPAKKSNRSRGVYRVESYFFTD